MPKQKQIKDKIIKGWTKLTDEEWSEAMSKTETRILLLRQIALDFTNCTFPTKEAKTILKNQLNLCQN